MCQYVRKGFLVYSLGMLIYTREFAKKNYTHLTFDGFNYCVNEEVVTLLF